MRSGAARGPPPRVVRGLASPRIQAPGVRFGWITTASRREQAVDDRQAQRRIPGLLAGASGVGTRRMRRFVAVGAIGVVVYGCAGGGESGYTSVVEGGAGD